MAIIAWFMGDCIYNETFSFIRARDICSQDQLYWIEARWGIGKKMTATKRGKIYFAWKLCRSVRQMSRPVNVTIMRENCSCRQMSGSANVISKSPTCKSPTIYVVCCPWNVAQSKKGSTKTLLKSAALKTETTKSRLSQLLDTAEQN